MARSSTSDKEREPLTRDRVLRAAVQIADQEGIAALSMRKLARELGFEVMSLYNHVANKDDMLGAILDHVVADIELPCAEHDWKDSLRASSLSAHEVLTRHPWAADLWMKMLPGSARLRYLEAVLATLRGAGFSKSVTYHGYHAVTMHTVGFVLQEANFTQSDVDLDELIRSVKETLPVENYPNLIEHIGQHLDGSEHDDFVYVLDLILDGLEHVGR